VAHGPKRYSELLPSNARNRVDQERPEQSNSVRRAGDGASRAGGASKQLKGVAADIEKQAGIETLAGYVARELAPAMRQATNWQELHDALSEHGLQIKQRGAGLVIGDGGLNLWCKASSAGRDLSAKALSVQLGDFESDRKPSGVDAGSQVTTDRPVRIAGKGYAAKPMHQHHSSARLYADYQKERAIALAGRQGNSKSISKEATRRRAELRAWGVRQRAIIKATAKGPSKKMMLAQARMQIAAQREAIATDADMKRKASRRSSGQPSWNDWLSNRAERGDVDALAVLRSRAEREEKMRGDLLTAGRADEVKTVILDNLKAVAGRDGSMSYRTADGGVVVDRSSHVQAKHATAGSAFVALSLASKRFEGQALDVRGTELFRRDVAELAGFHGINVIFADPMLEKTRVEALARRQSEETQPINSSAGDRPTDDVGASSAAVNQQDTSEQKAIQDAGERRGAGVAATPSNGADVAKPKVSAAVMNFIEKRNSQRENISSIDYNRLWTPKDAGTAIYQGRRKMEDGTEVLLLKRADEMLVKPSTANVVAKASRWVIGSPVELDARGRFISKDKGLEL
jgi:hypothetical protein